MGLILDGTSGISASGNITAGNFFVTGAFTPASLSVVGNVQGDYIKGNGSALTAINGANVTGAVPSATGAATATTAATVTTAAQPNITSVGILSSVSVSGTATAGQFTGEGGNLSNIQGANVTGIVAQATQANYANTANAVAGSNVSGTVGSATTAATVTTAAQPNITSVGALSSLSVSGNITAPNVVLSGYVAATQGLQASSNYTGPYVDGLALDYVTGNGRISVGTLDGIIFYNGGVASTELAALSSAGAFSATGNLSGGNLSVGTGTVIGGGLTIFANTISTANTTMYLDPLADGVGTGNVVVLGNLDVRGTTTTINSNTVAINDLTFVVANNASSSAQADGAGLAVGPDPSHYAELTFNTAGNTWVSSIALSVVGNIATGGTIDATANITGGNIKTGGLISSTGNITGGNINGQLLSGTTVSITGNIYASNASATGSMYATAFVGSLTGTATTATTAATVTTAAQPNITSVGTLSSLYVSGAISVGGGIVNTAGNAVGNIGGTGAYFNTIFAKATSALYADLAEMYCADAAYVPGTVVEFGGEQEVTQTTQSHSVTVAGIVSTNPSYLMNATLACENSLEIALVGRVPCFVVGTIRKGDRLVASGTPGAATALNMNLYQPGCIVGKALEDYNSTEVGTIEVAVGRI